MASVTINAPASSGFVYSNSKTARLCITAETPEFDRDFLRAWQSEGFNVVYVPFSDDGKEYISRLMAVKEGLSVGDNYAVIAFGDAASFCMDFYLRPNNVSRLCALVSYYPTNIPDTRSRFPPSVHLLTHLAGGTIDVTTTPTLIGLQGKKRRSTRQINPGSGTGERLDIGHRAYTYGDAQPGFAEHDLDEYNRLASELAFSRTLEVLRTAFGREADLELPWETHLEAKFFSMNLNTTMDQYATNLTPVTTYTPTLTGATGARALQRFYAHHFTLPQSMHLRLISRTLGSDRVVDELFVSFQHTEEIPWMLPGVPPTNRKVEIVLVSIVSLRGGKLYSEHVYWDQASVLVQVGLLDPKLVPQGVQGVDRLPVIGRESARRILGEDPEREETEYHNRLIRRGRSKRRGSKQGSEQEQEKHPAQEDTGVEKGENVQREDAPAGVSEEAKRGVDSADEKEDEDNAGNGTQNRESEEGKSRDGAKNAHVEDESGHTDDDDHAENGDRDDARDGHEQDESHT